MATISRIVRTPRPGSPTSHATVPSSSGSDEALLRLPSLSLRRWMRNTFREPSGRTRGTRKQDSPASPEAVTACARTRKTSHIGALVNHLCPRSDQVPSPRGVATVVPARTSDPPCFSVIPMPASRPRLDVGSRSPGSYDRLVSSGSYTAASSGACRSTGTTAYVIDTGQPCPASTCPQA